ncbi:glycoside hydrolase family 13 protein [Halobacillus salinarum]|uniref:Glycoside hydrolase family 13 protein n=1 Tax=Halobacillus salinarum TaxID=2932257 RepID=A0ABY4EKM3_9BACI|nr:glycoside hydrolase family 13 protein [Halobacillus salinarum]UOQ45022.1 glycoside hydrolase family 13 protein [Halobacillus salinarum]
MKQQDIYHNSFDLKYREPFGAAPKGSNVFLTIDIHHQYQVSRVVLHYIFDSVDEEHTKEMDLYSEEHQHHSFETTITVPEEPQLVWYYFEINTEEATYYYGRENIEESGEGLIYSQVPPSWQITVYDDEYKTPKWWKHATMYQIFPDRFHVSGEPDLEKAPKTSLMHTHWENDPVYVRNARGEVIRWDFFGGTLQGIIDKLDYIESLGTTVIYLNPIFEAESNHRYDTGDYHKIDCLLGTKEDFEKLIEEAESRGMEIMLDGVFSHTGSNSIYFNQKGEYDSLGAYQSKESPYYPWYTFYNYPDDYEAWWGVGTLPTLNKSEQSYLDFLIHEENSVIKYWQKAGMKHWRLDVADELTDDLISQLNQQLKKVDESSVLLGEVWEDASNKSAYGTRRKYFLGGVLDSVMNYPLRQLMLGFIKNELDAYYIERRLLTLSEHYPAQYFYALMNMLSSHDVERVKTLLNDYLPDDLSLEEREEIVKEQMKGLSLWLYTFPGIPSLYYGDEAGVTGGADPDNRKPYPWGKEDKELLSWYKKLGKWRKKHPALRTGAWKSHALHKDVYGFERSIENEADEFGEKMKDDHLLFLINRNYREKREVSLPLRQGKWQHMRSKEIIKVTEGTFSLTLQPGESLLLRHMH